MAEGALEKALEAEDPKTELNAIRAAVDVMVEARQYMELHGELTGRTRRQMLRLVRVLSVPSC